MIFDTQREIKKLFDVQVDIQIPDNLYLVVMERHGIFQTVVATHTHMLRDVYYDWDIVRILPFSKDTTVVSTEPWNFDTDSRKGPQVSSTVLSLPSTEEVL